MTDCPNGEIRDLLPDLLHDRLMPEVRRDVEAHVRDCEDCQQELALLRAMRSSLRRAPSVNVAAIAAAIPAYARPARRSWAGWRAAAAIMILAAGGTTIAVLQRGDAVGRDSVAVVAPVSTPVAARVSDSIEAAAQPAADASRELALGNAAVSDLDDGELSALLADLQSLEVLPSADVESSPVVSAGATTGTD
jgi:anti-sigma factor RsiW